MHSTISYRTLKDTVPTIYGDSVRESIANRALHLIINQFPNNKGKIYHWEKNIKSPIRYAPHNHTIINLPHKKITLREAIAYGYIKKTKNKFKINIDKINNSRINTNLLIKETIREILLALSVGLGKEILSFICTNASSIVQIFFCAPIIGIIKVFVKYFFELWENKKSILSLLQKCGIEIFAEIITTALFIFLEKKLYIGLLHAIKALLRHISKRFLENTFIFTTYREIFLEMAKVGIKGESRAYGSHLMVNQIIFGNIIGSIFGSTIIAAIFNIFIDQAFI